MRITTLAITGALIVCVAVPAVAAAKKAYRSPPGRAARSRPRVTAGWSMPGSSAIMANS